MSLLSKILRVTNPSPEQKHGSDSSVVERLPLTDLAIVEERSFAGDFGQLALRERPVADFDASPSSFISLELDDPKEPSSTTSPAQDFHSTENDQPFHTGTDHSSKPPTLQEDDGPVHSRVPPWFLHAFYLLLGTQSHLGDSMSSAEAQQLETVTSPRETRTLYFAYGSNLSLLQMSQRCPTSVYYGFGILREWRWFINDRGYANVIRAPKQEGKDKEFVEGMLYWLEGEDERRLDSAEGVPNVYRKEELDVEVTRLEDGGEEEGLKVVKALVYVDVERTEGGVCREEYVFRMNRGIRDARGTGMSEWYIQNVMRKWVPEEEGGEGNSEMAGVVRDPFFEPERYRVG